MNILINFLSSYSGGARTYIQRILPIINKQENICVYYLLHRKQLTFLNDLSESNIIMVSNPLLAISGRHLFEGILIKRIIKKYKINKIFCPYQIGKNYPTVENILMLRNMDPFYFHNYNNSLLSKIRNNVLRHTSITSLKKADKIVAVSSYAAEYLKKNLEVPEKIIRIIHHGKNSTFNHFNNDGDDELLLGLKLEKHKYIFTCGSIFPYRRVEDIVNAFSSSNLAGKKLVIAGSGKDKNYQNQIYKMIISSEKKNNIILLGEINHDKMPILYRNCDIFVTSTEVEACPNIAIEALASGCAIISSDCQPMPEMFENAAEYYPARDIALLVKKLNSLSTDNEKKIKLRQKAIERSKYFDWNKTALETLEFIIGNNQVEYV